ncbi:protein of unknown function [Thauera humireducens]|nr:protein of unknown function [Thauera humireducens]
MSGTSVSSTPSGASNQTPVVAVKCLRMLVLRHTLERLAGLHDEQLNLISAKEQNGRHLVGDARSGMRRRFPARDEAYLKVGSNGRPT